MGSPESVTHHLKYKYQLLIDGNSSAFSRAYWQLFSNAVILKQSSPYFQWYYRALQPYVHFIPLQNDLGDLIEKIDWAITHDEACRAISREARAFAHQNLSRNAIDYYLYLVLREYRKLQIF